VTILDDHTPGIVPPSLPRSVYSIDDIKKAVINSYCMSDVLKLLNLSVHGGNAVTIKRLISINHIDITATKQRNKHRWNKEDIFIKKSPLARSSLRCNVLKWKVLPIYECDICRNNGTHNGSLLSLTVDHIDGISDNNEVSNLRWLCPNCHSQTDNYCGKRPK
jgi:hypothetical protein